MLSAMGRGRVDVDRGLARLASYAKYHGHANPPASEVWLEWRVGLWVSQLRVKYRSDQLTDAQTTTAKEIGVRFAPPYRDLKPRPPTRERYRETEYLKRLDRLQAFHRKHGHINVPQLQGTSEWPGAGRWITSLRSRYRRGELPPAVVEAAESMNIAWNPGPGTRPQ